MAEMTIRLVTNPETGRKDILVDLRSDADALPHEHEQFHRQLVEQLIEGGTIKASEVGQVIIEREEESPQSEGDQRDEAALSRESLGEGA